jgi:tetratricopeptide (TPR) repeat protein
MRNLVLALAMLASAWTFGGAAVAADKPVVAPPEAWVKPNAIPTPKDEKAGAYRLLLADQQANFGPDGDAYYIESANRLQNTEALTGGGTVSLNWNPENDVLTIHKVHILRGDQVIDVLAKQSFTVLRRETNLERATLDGQLTATLQVEGLQVGDVLDVAYTVKRHDPAMQGRSNGILGWPSAATDHSVVRALWTAPKQMQWKAAGGLGAPKVIHRGAVTELVLDKENVPESHPPKGAPARYRLGPQLELTEFGSWAEASALMTPLYDKASQLPADSPLKAEAAKIRAASSDPKVQAAMALALVQSKVRYLFLGMRDGGYVPAAADLTWERRFGDCKGKTVLLLALLRELHIEAQPSLIATTQGDGMDARLPTLALFDHVMVRATVGGKVYWMDGTRMGDRGLDSLKPPNFHWSLPEQASGATLVKLAPEPPAEPNTALSVRMDASKGLLAPATIHVESVSRGDTALATQLGFTNMAAPDRDRFSREAWQKAFPKLTITGSSMAYDEASGVFKMTMDGTLPLDWNQGGGRFLRVDDANLGWKPDFHREPGPGTDAPFAVRYPYYTSYRMSLILPRGGAGFVVPAPDVDVKVAGWSLHRRSRLENGVMTIERTMKSLAPEFPASEAEAADKQLTELVKTQVFVRAPTTYVPTDGDMALLAAGEPKTAREYISRGDGFMRRGEYDKALADLDKAVAADPKDSLALSNRGIAHYWKGENELARADFAAAARLNGRDVVALHGQGLLALRESRLPDAIAAFTRAADLLENNAFALSNRASAYQQLGQYDNALADVDELMRINPQMTQLMVTRSELLRAKGDKAGALAALEAALKANPRDQRLQLTLAAVLAEDGHKADADKAFAAAIAAQPTVAAYLSRATYRDKADTAGRLADVDAALKLDAKSSAAMAMRAQTRMDAGDAAKAASELTEAMKTLKDEDQLLVARAKALAKAGDLKGADADLTRFSQKYAKNAAALNEACWTRATFGVDLKKALADCESSLALYPTAAQTLDSRGFVLLRLGRYEEAVAAYAEALKLRPRMAESLYGRGLAELSLQRAKEGQADVAAARAISAKVEQEFADWGVKEASARETAAKAGA